MSDNYGGGGPELPAPLNGLKKKRRTKKTIKIL